MEGLLLTGLHQLFEQFMHFFFFIFLPKNLLQVNKVLKAILPFDSDKKNQQGIFPQNQQQIS